MLTYICTLYFAGNADPGGAPGVPNLPITLPSPDYEALDERQKQCFGLFKLWA